ncbi:ATPase [Arthrobacter sp. Leaf337]|uniref:ATPase n=1 Tax=Arthrobacter sp. Leaf337 TaxID=1736342 RepID=UPI0006F6E25E|nr:ATPase [Arthrobacter sp. Leaf337]KQR65386.1 ATPase [Arthrobacter sp. Leaf337]
MPESADKNARATAHNAGQPQTRRRRDLRRPAGASPDARTGTMPAAATPNNSRTAPTRRSSWAEAAAVADAQVEAEGGAEVSAAAPVPAPVPASAPAVPAQPTAQPVAQPASQPEAQPATSRRGGVPAEPSAPPSNVSRQAAKLAAADAPISDFITSPGSFVREQKPRPRGGFRGALFALTGGAINLGPGPRQREEDELGRRISRQLQGSYNTAVLSLKGGIGKTSTTVGVGLTLAEFRGDAPCAIDANPDSGDLVERALGEGIYQQSSPRTITDLLKNIDSVDSLTALARYMHHAGRLHLIAGEQDPEVSDSLTAEEYLRIRKLISGYYSVALTDCGTGVTHNAMSGILQSADNLVIAAGYAVSGAKRARSTLQWLASHGYEDLARNAIVVITDKDEVSSRVDKDAIEEHLSGICRQLIAVPHDRGVADGDLVTLDVLRPETRRAYKEIAAAIVDGYV